MPYAGATSILGAQVVSTTYCAGSRLSSLRPAGAPLIVPPLLLAIVMVTVPLLPMGWRVLVPVSATSTSTPLSMERVLSSAESPGLIPVEVCRMSPAGGSIWQPHWTSKTLLSRLVQESVISPTR